MLYAIPRLHPRAHLEPLPEGGHRISAPPPANAETLTAGELALLLFADACTTLQHIVLLASTTLDPPPGNLLPRLSALCQRLADASLLRWTDPDTLSARVLPGTEHRCTTCGRACEGHRIGPLPQSEIEAIRAALPEIAAARPALDGAEPFLQGDDGVYLNTSSGACLFFDTDRLCLLHKLIGPALKPSICRSFPISRVRTERGDRVGVSLSCLGHHAHLAPSHGPPVLLPEGAASLAPVLSDASVVPVIPASARLPEDIVVEDVIAEDEDALVQMLGQPDATLTAAMARILEVETHAPLELTTLPFEVVARSLELVHAVAAYFVLEDEARGQDSLAGDAHAFVTALQLLSPEVVAREWSGAPRDDEVRVLDALRRFIWLREYLDVDVMDAACVVMVAGWLASTRIALPTGFCISLWHRMICGELASAHINTACATHVEAVLDAWREALEA